MPKKKTSKRSRKNEKRILNCLPSPHTEKDWAFENATKAGVVAAPAALPPSKDLRESWWKISNQGSTGSCVGWGTADALLRWHFVKANRLGKDEKLSVRYVWMASKETDEFTNAPTTFIETDGTSLKSALDIVRKYGVVTDKVLSFGSGRLYKDEANTFYALASQRKIASYFNLHTNISAWRTWLGTKGPILTRLDVDATWDNASATNGNLDIYQPSTARGGHCVALVGYTPDRFIVRNSWGTSWGDGGFAFASLQYAQAAFTEAYGVSL
jgi:C1A family cysteine protease